MKEIVICAIARMENHYIREWVEYYRNMGVDQIILGDNNFPEEEHFEDVISDYINSGYVIIKNYRGLQQQQITFYNNVYQEYKNDFKWFGFFDIDEYVFIEDGRNIVDFLNNSLYDNYRIIRLNWKCYGDNDLVTVSDEDYSVMRRFKTPMKRDIKIGKNMFNANSKTFMRGGLDNISVGVHGNGTITDVCDATGKIIRNNWLTDEICWDIAYIKHYNTKTIEEWMQKIKRGYPDKNFDNKNMLSIDRFFMFNKRTQEKLDFINTFYIPER